MKGTIRITAAALLLSGSVSAFSTATISATKAPPRSTSLFLHRRDTLHLIPRITLLLIATSPPSHALDMDAFVSSQLEKDTSQCNPKLDPKCIPKLSPDEALCKYGVAGSDARLEACKKVRDAGGLLPTSKPGERNTAGWVNNPIAL